MPATRARPGFVGRANVIVNWRAVRTHRRADDHAAVLGRTWIGAAGGSDGGTTALCRMKSTYRTRCRHPVLAVTAAAVSARLGGPGTAGRRPARCLARRDVSSAIPESTANYRRRSSAVDLRRSHLRTTGRSRSITSRPPPFRSGQSAPRLRPHAPASPGSPISMVRFIQQSTAGHGHAHLSRRLAVRRTTAESVKRHLWAMRKRYERARGEPLVGPWKLELQSRGAPHFHISTTPPMGFTTIADPETGRLRSADFRAWLSITWPRSSPRASSSPTRAGWRSTSPSTAPAAARSTDTACLASGSQVASYARTTALSTTRTATSVPTVEALMPSSSRPAHRPRPGG